PLLLRLVAAALPQEPSAPSHRHELDGLAGAGRPSPRRWGARGELGDATVDDLHDDPGARGGAGFVQNALEMLLDRLFDHAQFVGDFLIRPALHEKFGRASWR